MTQRTATVAAILIAAPFALGMVAADTRVHRDPAFDFSPLKTWAWNPEGAGDVKMVTTPEAKPESVKRQYEPTLMQAIEDGFGARGYKKAASYSPDFVVTYRLLITIGSASQAMGDFLPANAGWGIPPFAPATTFLEVYPMGTLIVDVQLPATGKFVWRGIAEAKIEMENSPAKREARIKSVTKDLLSKFPKTK